MTKTNRLTWSIESSHHRGGGVSKTVLIIQKNLTTSISINEPIDRRVLPIPHRNSKELDGGFSNQQPDPLFVSLHDQCAPVAFTGCPHRLQSAIKQVGLGPPFPVVDVDPLDQHFPPSIGKIEID